jgi:hypothetical protein
MIGRVRGAFGALVGEQRRVVLAAALVLVSMLLPWYSKTSTGFSGRSLQSTHESKMAIFVPSFVEASIFLVAVAVLVLMFARGEGKAFHLPFGDGIVVSAAGAWVGFLVFYRFIDQPAGGRSNNLVYTYDLSWGIFFGLLAAAFLVYAGTRLRLARVAEPPLPGEAPTAGPAPQGPRVRDRRAEREAERAERERRRRAAAAGPDAPTTAAPAERPPRDDGPPTAATSIAPAAAPTTRRPPRPEIDGGTQLSFDEQE